MVMRTDLFVYLSGPITARVGYTVEENVVSALLIYIDLLERGIPSFCPQLSGIFPSAHQVPYKLWIAYDFAVIRRCTHMLMLPRWETSPGALRERAFAKEIGIPVVEMVGALLELIAAC